MNKEGCGKDTFTKLYGKNLVVFCGDIILGKIVLCTSCHQLKVDKQKLEEKKNHSQQTKPKLGMDEVNSEKLGSIDEGFISNRLKDKTADKKSEQELTSDAVIEGVASKQPSLVSDKIPRSEYHNGEEVKVVKANISDVFPYGTSMEDVKQLEKDDFENCGCNIQDRIFCEKHYNEMYDNLSNQDVSDEICPYCGGLKRIRNPTGNCDHLYYPENVNKDVSDFEKEIEIKIHPIWSRGYNEGYKQAKQKMQEKIKKWAEKYGINGTVYVDDLLNSIGDDI